MAYRTGQQDHFNICNTYDVFAPKGEAEKVSSHAGWEIIYTPNLVNFTAQKMRVRGRDFESNPGEILFYNAFEPHAEIYSQLHNHRALALVIQPEFLRDLLAEAGIEPDEVIFSQLRASIDTDLAARLDELFELREVQEAGRTAFECRVTELVLRILRSFPSSASQRLQREFSRGAYPSTVAKTLSVIAREYGESDLDLDTIAGQVGISKFHLVRVFKDATGLSPIRYLNQVRIEKAKGLLRRGRLSKTAIAAEVGFDSYSAFRKSMRKHAPV